MSGVQKSSESSYAATEYEPCTYTIACIPQGITDEQTCRLQADKEDAAERKLHALREEGWTWKQISERRYLDG